MLFLIYRSANTSVFRIYRRWKTWKFSILRKYRRRLADVECCPVSECVPNLSSSVQHSAVMLHCSVNVRWSCLIWPDLIRLFAWNYRYSISDSLHSQPDKNAYRIQLIPPQRRKIDLMLIRMRCSFHTGSLLQIEFVTFSCPLKRINVDL